MPPEESVDWDTTQNLMIEGDNLEVLKLLQKGYNRRIKAIYIDPPYNTGNNLIYPNDYQDGMRTYLQVTGQIDGGIKLTSNPVSGGRFHTNWLSMIYPRLKLARNLLSKDGVLICTIDDNEVTQLGMVLKEVFEEGSYDHVVCQLFITQEVSKGKIFHMSMSTFSLSTLRERRQFRIERLMKMISSGLNSEIGERNRKERTREIAFIL